MMGGMGGGWRGRGGLVGDQAVATTGVSVRTFESLKNPSYRLYWLGMMGQMGAMNMQIMARSWFMYALTDSTALLGAMSLASAIPMLSFSLFGGVIADRVQKKSVLIAAQIAFFVIAIVIGLAITFGIITWVWLIVYSVFHSTIISLMMPSRQAIVPEIVGREMLTNALALNAAGMNITRLVAPAVAGLLIASPLGIEGVYYLMAGMYLLALLALLPLPRTSTSAIRGEGAWTDIRDGARYVREHPTILTLLIVTLLMVLLSMPIQTLLPAMIKEGLDVTNKAEIASKQGILWSVSGIGALVGSLIVASLPAKKRGLLFLSSGLFLGVFLILFSFSTWYAWSLFLMIPIGLAQTGRQTFSNTLVQDYVDDEYRGRVMSIYMLEFGLSSFGVFFVALIAEFAGTGWSVGGTSLLLVAVSLYYLLFSPHIKRLD